ncbi:MAG: glycosyltransferase family 2 protein, partial [Planctomycetes bacterium]|nr:glycosyltransferase family 2 protein [Planctomycetota bacterium]
ILFVDDGSTDGTDGAVAALHESDKRVGLIQLSRNFGHQSALMAGLDHAKGEAVIAMDADLEHVPELLPELVARWRHGAMVVQTARIYPKTVGRLKRVTSGLFYAAMRKLSSVPLVPGATDFYLLDRKVVEAIKSCRETARFTRGLVSWVGYPRETVTYTSGQRHAGVSKYGLERMLTLGLDAVFAFSVAPIRLCGAAGLMATLIGVCYLLYAAGVRLLGTGAVPGWASLVAVVVFMSGMQLIILWIVGEYIARIAEQTRNRPRYLVHRTLSPAGDMASPPDASPRTGEVP